MFTKQYNEINSVIDGITAHEQGELDFDATVELFQQLLDSGLVWTLQGNYGRTAQRLIDEGYIIKSGGK